MGRLIGTYELGARIAAGGMAEIFHATRRGDAGFAKELCVKLIQPQLSGDPEFKRMFENEALIAGSLQHANVVQAFDYSHDGDTYYIVMEYVFGRDLRSAQTRAAERGERLPLALAARICHDAARGLAAAHRLMDREKQPLPVIHRDVSPHNILLSFAGEVKLTDFGIARLRDADTHTRTGMLKGKPNYMSPEQADGAQLDVRSDVFSLGIVLWELLTAARLFDGDSDMQIMKKVITAEIPRPSAAGRYVPHELEEIVMKALERGRESRFDDAGTMADALQKFLYSFTHELEEESVAAFLAHLYPEEKGPARREKTAMLPPDEYAAPSTPAPGPVPAAPAGRTLTQPDARARRQKLFAAVAVAAAIIAVVALAGWYYTKSGPPPAAPPSSMALHSQPSTLNAHPPTVSPKPAPAVCTPSAADSCADPAPAKTAAPEEPAPAPARKSMAAQTKAAEKTGRLTLNANPWADIYLKGKKIGTTPLTNHPLPMGTHTLVLKNPEINAQKEITVRIAPGELTTVPVDLLAR